MAVADPLNDYAAIERAAIAGDPWALGYVASHQAAVSALADAWDEGRQWLAEQGGDVTTDDDPNPYRAALAAAGAATGNSAFPVADEAVERAARAIDPAPWRSEHPGSLAAREVVREKARAALAAAGAGAEADREALLDALAYPGTHHPDFCDCSTDGDRCIGIQEQATRVLALLAARGDAATPTEVEANDGPGPDGRHVVTGECFACMVGVATGPESHAADCPSRGGA